MAANLERLAQEWMHKGYPEMAEYLNTGAKKARKLNAPEFFSGEENITLSPALSIEIVRGPLSSETQKLVEHMRKDGYAVYDLAGKTPATLRTEGMHFLYVNPVLENASADPALIAFKPKPSEFFLKGSQSTPYKRHLELLEEEKAQVEKRYAGAGLIVRVGKPSEWSEAVFEHFKATDKKVRIFGEPYGYNYTWADAYESNQLGTYRAFVGGWREAYGLSVNFSHSDDVYSHSGLASLVEIPRK